MQYMVNVVSLDYSQRVGTHRDPLSRLTLSQWLRYRRLYRAMAEDAWRRGEPLTVQKRTLIRAMARTAARHSHE